jgi:hypothetical protein
MFVDPLGQFDGKGLASLFRVSNRRDGRAEQIIGRDEFRSRGRGRRRISYRANDAWVGNALAVRHVPAPLWLQAVAQ